MGEQFQRGNILKQNDRDEPPPSNLYSTERVIENSQSTNNRMSINSFPFNKDTLISDKLARNRLINEEDQIDFIESDGGDR